MLTIQYMIYIFNIQSSAMHAKGRMRVYALFLIDVGINLQLLIVVYTLGAYDIV
jgi:hypothetical protein